MKQFLILFIGIILSGTFITSCNEKVDLIGDFTETAVVYGLLDKADSVHYIKINRAFIGPGNSLEIAQIPDSNYFDQIDATITEYVNDVQTRQWVLQDTIIENKETGGVFYAPLQKLYYFATSPSSPLNGNAIYKLHISVNGGEFEIDSETPLVTGVTCPSADQANYRYDFIDNDGGYSNNGLNVGSGTSSIISASLQVNFKEITMGSDTTMTSFNWKLGETEIEQNSTRSFTMSGLTFYNLVKQHVTDNPSINRRQLYSVKAIITGGAEDLYNYMTVNQPSSSLAQSKPTYTNLTATGGHRVLGIFSSRFTYSVEKLYINPFNTSLRMITKESVQVLCEGPITGDLFFCSQHPADNGESFSCQ